MSTIASPSGSGSGPCASTMVPSLRSTRASTLSPVQRSSLRRSIRSENQRSRSPSSTAMPAVIRAPLACPCASPTTTKSARASVEVGSSTKPRPPAAIHCSPRASRRLAINSGLPAARWIPGGGACPALFTSTRSCARRAQREASLRLASALRPRSPFQRVRRTSRSSPRPPRDRSCSNKAILAARSASPCSAPNRMVAAPCGSSGSCASLVPRSVIRPASSSAPSAASVERAASTEAAGGGSSHARLSGSAVPHCASDRTSGARSAVTISGGSKGGRPPWPPSSQRR